MKSNSKIYNHRGRRRGGQTLVETALVLSAILLPLTLGIVQFGIVLNATNTLNQIAREGGRYAAVHGTEGTTADAAIIDYVQACCANTSIKASDLPDANIVISMVGGAARASGNAIQVTITYPMTKKVFVGSAFFSVTKMKQNYVAASTFVLE